MKDIEKKKSYADIFKKIGDEIEPLIDNKKTRFELVCQKVYEKAIGGNVRCMEIIMSKCLPRDFDMKNAGAVQVNIIYPEEKVKIKEINKSNE